MNIKLITAILACAITLSIPSAHAAHGFLQAMGDSTGVHQAFEGIYDEQLPNKQAMLARMQEELLNELKKSTPNATKVSSLQASIQALSKDIESMRAQGQKREDMVLPFVDAIMNQMLPQKRQQQKEDRAQQGEIEVAKARAQIEADAPGQLARHRESLAMGLTKLKYAVPAVTIGAASLMSIYFILKKLSIERPKIIELKDTSLLSWFERVIKKVKVPASNLSSVILSPEKKRQVLDKFNGITQAIKKKLPLSNMLFYGTPGTGKTMTALAFARKKFEEGLAHHVVIRGAAFKRLGSAGAAQNELARVLRWAATSLLPIILIFDEAESMFIDRSSAAANEMTNDLVTTLLSFFEKAANPNMMFIMSTNYKNWIDKAILNRIDRSNQIEFIQPSASELSPLLDLYIKEHIIANGFKVDPSVQSAKTTLVEMLNGRVGREIDSLLIQTLYSLLSNNKKSLDAHTLIEVIQNTPPEVVVGT